MTSAPLHLDEAPAAVAQEHRAAGPSNSNASAAPAVAETAAGLPSKKGT